jgi:hypothetical protein
VNDNTGTKIRDAILRYWRFPNDLFVGNPATVSLLEEAASTRAVTAHTTR